MKKQAVMIVLYKDGKFLLGKRSELKKKAPGYWCPVSGHIEPGESEEEAVIREAREELGVLVRPLKKITSIPTRDGTTDLHWWLSEILEGTPEIANEENSAIRWFSKDELKTLSPSFQEDLEILLKLPFF